MWFVWLSIQSINPSSDSLSAFSLDFVSITAVNASISDTFILIISIFYLLFIV